MKKNILLPSFLFTLALTGCQTDNDGDGLLAPEDGASIKANEDCNDDDATIGAPSEEICDGIDNDCDGEIDEGVITTFYLDRDGDGYGSVDLVTDSDLEPVIESCYQPIGYVLNADDCDDTNASVHPSGVEVCDAEGIDEDCDGSNEDSDAIGQSSWFPDVDGDGYGDDDAVALEQCYAPDNYVGIQGDCDDALAEVNSAASEIAGDMSNFDENCDGFISCFVDSDKDGYGAGEPVSVPNGTNCVDATDEGFDGLHTYSRTSTDCDDTDGDTHPSVAFEEPGTSCMRDADGDGYGDANLTVVELNTGLVAGSDCDDSTNMVSPSAAEIPANGVDENCNGEELCFVNSDNDDFGSTLPPISSTNFACDGDFESNNQLDCDDNDADTYPGAAENEPAPLNAYCTKDADGDGYADLHVLNANVFAGTDCDDGLASVNSSMVERCDTNYDDDCDGLINDISSVDASFWYVDVDDDGFGDEFVSGVSSCEQPVGYVSEVGDCDDSNGNVYPGAPEDIASGGDQNCDGYEACYLDGDGDGFGSSSVTYSLDISCMGSNQSVNADDCDDASFETHPGVAFNESDSTQCMKDLDGDGFGDADPGLTGVAEGIDCNDNVSTISPDGTEMPADGVDSNCNGVELCYLDADGDGFGRSTGDTVGSEDLDCTDAGESSNIADCDDLLPSVNPDALEYCNDVDDNCDGSIDEGAGDMAPLDAPFWYVDADGDGFGGASIFLEQCEQPAGFVEDSLDCNDLDSTVAPDVEEICFDGLDNDCDGEIDSTSLCVVEAVTASSTLSGAAQGDMAGHRIAVGDIDGDGVEDMLVSAPQRNDGVVYVMYGPVGIDQDLVSQYDAELVGISTDSDGSTGLGADVALVDLNGNGRKDIVVSAKTDDSTGLVYVLHSTQTSRLSGTHTMDAVADAVIDGTESDVQLGCELENGGDMDGDGYEELLLGTCNPTAATPGYAGLIYGQVDNLDGFYELDRSGINTSLANSSVVLALFQALNTGGAFGSVLSKAGDLNADGLDDILFGDPNNFASNDGSVYVLYGDETQFEGAFSLSTMSAFANGDIGMQHGGSLGPAGDVNGDGFDDFWVGAPDSRTEKGYVQLYLGASTELSGEVAPVATIIGASDNDRFGDFIQPLGDLNMDGYADVAISATGDSNVGSVHVFYGPISGTIDLGYNGTSSGKISGRSMGQGLNSNFGVDMAFVDLNANGVSELIISASRDDSGGRQDAGAVFAFGTLFQ